VLWKPDWIHVHGNCAVVSLFWDQCMLWLPWLPGLSRFLSWIWAHIMKVLLVEWCVL
jgi:hypothetical protein